MERRKITDSIVVHCSATPEGREHSAEDIRKWHLARGFADIGYHYVVRIDGVIEPGRAEWAVGAHCKEGGMNSRSIGVCYVGGMDKDMKKPKDTRTAAQTVSLKRLVGELRQRYGIPESRVFGHRDFAAKACPSFDVRDLLKIFAVVLLLCTGCTRKVYVPFENTSLVRDTVSVVRWREIESRDRDTVSIITKGDTVVKDVVRWRERFVVMRDTAEGYDALMTVTEDADIPLGERVNRVNAWCDKLGTKNVCFVSIHTNAAPGEGWQKARGWEAWTSKGQTQGDKLADCLYDAAERVLKPLLPGVSIRTDMTDGDRDKESNFTVIARSRCAACLTENLFHNNREDVDWLLSSCGRDAIVRLHVEGIKAYVDKYGKR